MRIIFCILISLLLCCGSESKKTENEKDALRPNTVSLNPTQLKNVTITTGIPERSTISRTVKVNGKIDVPPQNLVSISVPLGGYLRSTQLLPGMHVKKGEVIAVLEDPQYIELQQNFLMAKSKLEMAEAEFLRQKELNQSKASSDKVYQIAKSDYENLKISLAALSEKLGMINIDTKTLNESNLTKSIKLYAPFDGYVSAVNVNIGKYLNPSDVLFELVNPLDIHLNLIVFEKDLSSLAIGQRVTAFTNSNPDKKYNCEILLVSQNISSDRSAEVHCHFEKYDKSLLPGMYMNAEISVQNQNALIVPESAIVAYQGKNYVFILESAENYSMRAVETGIIENGLIELLNAEDLIEKKVVTEGAYTLLMALKNTSEN